MSIIERLTRWLRINGTKTIIRPERVKTYEDFLLYTDWLKEQGQDVSWRERINKKDYLALLSFYLPGDVLYSYRTGLITDRNKVVRGHSSHAVKIKRNKSSIEFTFDPIDVKRSFTATGNVIYNHVNLEVVRLKFEEGPSEVLPGDQFRLHYTIGI